MNRRNHWKERNKTEVSNLAGIKFKTIIIRMLEELRREG